MSNLFAGVAAIVAIAALGLADGVASATSTSAIPTDSQQFAGYSAVQNGESIVRIHSVTANWIEPKVIPNGYHNTHAAFMVGFIDINGQLGGSELNMPQIGTEADSIGGIPRYHAWHSPSRVPNCGMNCHPVVFRNSIRPGDHMSASAVVRGPAVDHYTLKLTDVRYRKHHPPLSWKRTVHFINEYGPMGMTIGMAPFSSSRLADFGTVHFTGAKLNGRVLGSFDPYMRQRNYIRYVDDYTHLLATTSSLGSNGDRFSVIWKRSG